MSYLFNEMGMYQTTVLFPLKQDMILSRYHSEETGVWLTPCPLYWSNNNSVDDCTKHNGNSYFESDWKPFFTRVHL